MNSNAGFSVDELIGRLKFVLVRFTCRVSEMSIALRISVCVFWLVILTLLRFLKLTIDVMFVFFLCT